MSDMYDREEFFRYDSDYDEDKINEWRCCVGCGERFFATYDWMDYCSRDCRLRDQCGSMEGEIY